MPSWRVSELPRVSRGTQGRSTFNSTSTGPLVSDGSGNLSSTHLPGSTRKPWPVPFTAIAPLTCLASCFGPEKKRMPMEVWPPAISFARADFSVQRTWGGQFSSSVSYTHLRAHETRHDLVCRLLL